MNQIIYIIRNGLTMPNADVFALRTLHKCFSHVDTVYAGNIADLLVPTQGKKSEKDILDARHEGLKSANAVIALMTTENAGDVGYDIAIAQINELPIYLIYHVAEQNLPMYVAGLEPLFHFTYEDHLDLETIAEGIRRLEKTPAGAPLSIDLAQKLERMSYIKMRQIYLLSEDKWKALDLTKAEREEIERFFRQHKLSTLFMRTV